MSNQGTWTMICNPQNRKTMRTAVNVWAWEGYLAWTSVYWIKAVPNFMRASLITQRLNSHGTPESWWNRPTHVRRAESRKPRTKVRKKVWFCRFQNIQLNYINHKRAQGTGKKTSAYTRSWKEKVTATSNINATFSSLTKIWENILQNTSFLSANSQCPSWKS